MICNHVLEHVKEDKKAMRELFRVLKVGGTGMINVPVDYSLEKSFEKDEYNTPELRLEHYGHPEHVRWYGNDFPHLLESAGFSVDILKPHKDMGEDLIKKYGVYRNETIYLARK